MFEKVHASTIDKYMKYKRIFGHYDENYKGKNFPGNLSFSTLSFTDFLLNVKLRYFRIYFDATTFDKIYKDSAAKGVDILSAIGGTMGLFTGFSIISAIEILYFVLKMILSANSVKIKYGNEKNI